MGRLPRGLLKRQALIAAIVVLDAIENRVIWVRQAARRIGRRVR